MSRTRSCDFCGREYEAQRSSSRFCAQKCRFAMHEHRKRTGDEVVSLPARKDTKARPQAVSPAGGVEVSTRALLESSGLVGAPLGAMALALAQRIDSAVILGESGSSIAAMARELRATLTEVTRGAQALSDPIDELRRHRQARLRGH
jgi:hypothetical protein